MSKREIYKVSDSGNRIPVLGRILIKTLSCNKTTFVCVCLSNGDDTCCEYDILFKTNLFVIIISLSFIPVILNQVSNFSAKGERVRTLGKNGN